MATNTSTTHYLRDYNYKSHELHDSILTVHTDGRIKLQIIVMADDMFRIWADPAGTLTREPSFAVADEIRSYEHFSLEESDARLSLTTGQCRLVLEKRPLRFSLFNSRGEFITGEYESGGLGWREDGSVFLYSRLGNDEHFYGLGQDNDAFHGNLDRRGSRREMITWQSIHKGCVTADIPVTFFVSTGNNANGYGLYLDNTYHSKFDMGKESEEYYYFDAEGGELLFYLFYGPKFDKILSQYTSLTGKPPLLPLWAYGYIQSKCTYRDWDDMDEVIERFRQKGIPMDCIVIDADWPENMNNFKFDPRFEGKSEERIRYHTKHSGVKFMLSTSGPMIKKDSSNFQSGLDAHIFATDGRGSTVTCGWYGGELMDFTAPNMKPWLEEQLRPLHDMGVQAWWLDLIEPEGEPLQTVYQGGPREKIHNAFALINTRVYYEIQKDFDAASRPFILGRTATAGIQKYGSATWTGDVYSDYDTLTAHCPEALNTVMSGIPAWTCDTSGFISSTADNELNQASQMYQNDVAAQALLYDRWLQFTCFTPLTRCHHVGPCEPFAHGDMVESSAARYLKLRYRLLPYIYSYAYRTHKDGMSIMRPLVYVYQDDPRVFGVKDEYLFGNEMLVAPVLNENAAARSVYFPEGRWRDYDFGYTYEGGREYIVYAPQNRIPVFVKEGSIIPMAPDMNYSDEKPWDPVTFEIYPAETASFAMYRDDGYTTAYENGEYTLTDITLHSENGRKITVCVSESNKLFTPEKYEFKIHMDYLPAKVNGLTQYSHYAKLQKAGAGWYYDRLRDILYVLIHTDRSTTDYIITVETGDELRFRPAAPRLDKSGRPIPADSSADAPRQIPYFLPPASIPCKLQLENYDRGGEGVSYHMLTKGNVGNTYRHEDVNIKPCTDDGGGYELASIYGGEWVEYTVNVEKEGNYDLFLRAACEEDGASFHVSFREKDLTGTVSIPNTGSAANWTTVHAGLVHLAKGEQVLQLAVDAGTVNLNYLELKSPE